MSQRGFDILPDGSVQQKLSTEKETRGSTQRVTSVNLHQNKQQPQQQQQQVTAASQKVRTVVCDDDFEEWTKAATASKQRRNYTTPAPQSSQVCSCFSRFTRLQKD